jgi:frataxin-like iron-binding protein CyaY
LLEANIVAMAVSPANQLWAASKGGFLYAFDGNTWQAHGRSYVAERWRPNLRAMVAKGKYIVLGTDKGLTFFDTDQKLAKVNLTKFGNLINASILSVIVKGDTLYFGTEKGVLKSAVDWNNILSNKYKSIFDPNIWLPVQFPPQKVPVDTATDTTSITVADTVARQFNHLVWHGDSLESYPRGQVRYGPIEVETVLGKAIKIRGMTYPDLIYFDVFDQIGDKIFIGGPTFFVLLSDAKTSEPGSAKFSWMRKSDVPEERFFNLASQGSNTLALTQTGLYKLENKMWLAVPGYSFYSPEILERNLRNLSVDKDGSAYIGTWGLGIIHLKDGKQTLWNGGNSPCMDTAVFNYTVVNATSVIHDGGMWATICKKESAINYDLVYLDINRGEVLCAIQNGPGKATHKIKVFPDNVLAVAGEGGTDLYTYNKSGGLQVKAWKSIRAGTVTESWDTEMDSFGRVWSLMLGKLVYAESLQTSGFFPEAKTFENFSGQDCRQMDADVSGSFWMGCANGLFHFSPAQVVEASSSQRYTIDDGLLSNTITDVSVNKKTGQVWVATDIGTSMFESESRRLATNFSAIKVYPNPFRVQHRFVIFENLPAGVEIRIHTQSGNVVKTFPPSSIKGGQCQWDGRSVQGNKVTPGIYLYSITGSGKHTQGKIIVAR